LASVRWLEQKPSVVVPPRVTVELTRKAIATQPDNPTLHACLGGALVKCGQFKEAAEAYEVTARIAPSQLMEWSSLAKCYLELELPGMALDACRRGEALEQTAELSFQRGVALAMLGRPEDARAAFLQALRIGPHLEAARAILKDLAKLPSGTELLDFCETAPPLLRETSLVRAFRAIAFSRLGLTERALQMVDLNRHVAELAFTPPPEFGSIEAFNDALAEDIQADPGKSVRGGCLINYAPRIHQSKALGALREFIRTAMESYLEELVERGLDAVMPPPPSEGWLLSSTVILRGESHNGAHVHPSYLSSVYYARVPDSVTTAADERGALVLGCCEGPTDGYTPCWGTRRIKPVAGALVIFPAHVYHDVIPSRTTDPRISVASDLTPSGRSL
jgi:hypothetical protein